MGLIDPWELHNEVELLEELVEETRAFRKDMEALLLTIHAGLESLRESAPTKYSGEVDTFQNVNHNI